MRRLIYLLLLMAGSASVCLMAGCASHKWHGHKASSYDRAIDDEDHDPTYHYDPERADLEVKQDQ